MGKAFADPIDVIEAAYELDRDDRDWLANIATAVRPLLDDGLGGWAYYFDEAEPAARWLDNAVTIGASVEQLRAAARLAEVTCESLVERMHTHAEPL